MSFSEIRSVHTKGHIIICMDRALASKKFLTCGTDGTVYVWDEKSLIGGGTPEIKSVADTTHSCCAWNGRNVFVGLTTTDLLTGVDKKIVGHCLFNNLESFSQLFTFSLEVNSIDASENYVVAGGSDFTVKKVNLKKNGPYDRIDTNGEILCVAIDPKEEVYAVACNDGTVTVLDINTNEKQCCMDFVFESFGDIGVVNSRHTLTWSTDGSHLYVPSQGCIKVIARDSWRVSCNSLKSNGTASDVFSTSCISRCGRYLCCSTLSNKIVAWDLGDGSVLAQYVYRRKEKSTISCMKFIPFSENDIVLVDVDEGLCVLKNAISSSSNVIEPAIKVDETPINGCNSRNDNDDDDSRSTGSCVLHDEDDGDTRMSVDIGAIKKKYGFGDDGSGRLDDYGFVASIRNSDVIASDKGISGFVPAVSAPHIAAYRPPRIPSFFVSGASPNHLSERYLKWNHYGVVRTYVGENGSSVEISYHDVSIHPTVVLDNGTTEYALADLSDKAIALASRREEKDEESELFVIHISSWDSESRRWNTKLPPSESAVDVLVSREMICLITNKWKLRVFSLTGTQRHIISHPSPILTATCFGTQLAICSVLGGDYYEKADQLQPDYQHVVSMYNLDSRQWYRHNTSVKSVNLPVACQEHLIWLGYTNHGKLVTMDSSYTVNLLAPSGFWVPIFDGSCETTCKSDGIWPIAVTEGDQRQIRYLYCKGSKYPLVAVKMTPFVAQWTLPYCSPESDKSKLEQELFLNELQQSELSSYGSSPELSELASSHLKSLIKLFALACKSDRDGRAAELSNLVTSAKGILMMCSYAAKLKKSTLADKVASNGRENVPLSAPTLSDNCVGIEHQPTPRPFLMKRKSDVLQPKPMLMEEDSLCISQSLSNFNDESESIESQEPGSSQQVVETLSSQSIVPMLRFSRNPFKRSELSADTTSVFDTTANKKRSRDEEASKSLASKQIKLQFGSSTSKDKRNTRTAYSLWMESNEESLRLTFSGNPEDFMKFCAQQFRMLSAAEKMQWKSRAETCQQ